MNTTVRCTSRAKSILGDKILAGAVKEGNDVKVIRQNNSKYLKWSLKNFEMSLKSLINRQGASKSEG
jgi:hypothetical protein